MAGGVRVRTWIRHAALAVAGIARHVIGRLPTYQAPGGGAAPRIPVDPHFLASMRTLYGPETADSLFVDMAAEAVRIAAGFDPDAIDWTTGRRRQDA